MNHSFHRLFLLTLIALGLLATTHLSFAQQSFGGSPRLLGEGTLRSTAAGISLAPDFNPRDLLSQETWREGEPQLKPYSVGQVIPCDIDFATAAERIGSVAETDIYRLEIEMEQMPVGLNLYYSDFFIPQGGRLYIYTPGGKQLLGAYTYETHPQHGAFASEPLSGSKLILDYEAPRGVALPSIQISGVGYFYRSVMQARHQLEQEDASDPARNNFCQLNVNCPEGDAWQEQKSSSVIYMPLSADGKITWCSGNLVNNVKGDFKPYILTAAHCSGEDLSSNLIEGEFHGKFGIDQKTMDQWVFGFHFEKPRCNNSDYAQPAKTLVGAYIRTYTSLYGYSDGMLLELQNDIPLDYRVYYSGWNATEQTWQSGAGIHHPAGDVAKLALYDKELAIDSWRGGGDKDHYTLKFHTGNTEGGSSGSPLYNEKGEQVATLTGGDKTPCSQDGFYGRLSSHFNKYADRGDLYHMDMFLDPDKTGALKVAGTWREGYKPLRPIRELRGKLDLQNHLKVELEWDAVPPHAQGYPVSYQIYRNGTPLKELTETKYTDELSQDLTALGSVSYAVEAHYAVEDKTISTPPAHRTIYTGKLVKEVHADVAPAATAEGVTLTWTAPLNAQIVSKIADRNLMSLAKVEPKLAREFSKNGISEICLVDKFRLGRSPFEKPLYVHQINLIPTFNKGIQRLYLQQKVNGSKEEVYPYASPAQEDRKWMSVLLKTPFKIQSDENLEVGFKVRTGAPYSVFIDSNSKDEYIGVDGGLEKFYIVKNEFIGYQSIPFTTDGYMALELVVSDNPTPSGKVIQETFTRGPLPVPFPEVKGYVIYRNDEKVGETDAATLTYSDAAGKVSDSYRVEVLYDAPMGLPINKVTAPLAKPYLYPSIIQDMTTLSEAEDVRLLQIFDLSGQCLRTVSGDALRSAIDLTDLPEGSYIALIHTAQESFTQRVMIKRN